MTGTSAASQRFPMSPSDSWRRAQVSSWTTMWRRCWPRMCVTASGKRHRSVLDLRGTVWGLIAYITIIVITMFVTPTEQLSIHETCQKEKADSGGLQQSSALEQRGGGNLVILSLSSVLIYMNVRGHIFLLSFCASIRQFLVAARKMQPHFVP